MTSDVEVELEGLEVSLVSWLKWVSGLQTQVVAGAPWDGRKLVGWEQFFKQQHNTGHSDIKCVSVWLHNHNCFHRATRQLQWNISKEGNHFLHPSSRVKAAIDCFFYFTYCKR